MNYWRDHNTHKRHQHFFLHYLWNVFKSAYFKEIFDRFPCALNPNFWFFYGRCLIVFWFIFAKVNFQYWPSKSKTVITILLLDSYCSVLGSGDRPNDGRSAETYRAGTGGQLSTRECVRTGAAGAQTRRFVGHTWPERILRSKSSE